jgi:hypothetical protein
MALNDAQKTNYATLLEAVKNGDSCLLEAFRRVGGESVALICAVYRDADEKTEGENDDNLNFVPLAMLNEGNPYETFVMEKYDVAAWWGEKGDETVYLRGLPVVICPTVNPGEDTYARKLSEFILQGFGVVYLASEFAEEVVKELPEEWSLSKKEVAAWLQMKGVEIDDAQDETTT